MHVAVFGSGRVAGIRARALAAHPLVKQVTIASRSRQNADRLAQELNGEVGSPDTILDGAVDAAVVAVVTSAHAEAVRRCIAGRVPVICEKPLSASLAESIALVTEADRAGVLLHVGFQRRFDPGFQGVQARITQGMLGELYNLRITAHDAEPGDEAYISTSGSMFLDMHVHDFDTVRWLTGEEIVEVDAVGSTRVHRRYARRGDVDVTALLLTTSSGIPAVITGSRHDPAGYDVRVEVLGASDAVGAGTATGVIPRALDPGALPPNGTAFTGFSDRFDEAFRRETAAFIEAARDGRPAPTPGSEAVAALQVAVAAEHSWQTGQRVRVADVETSKG